MSDKAIFVIGIARVIFLSYSNETHSWERLHHSSKNNLDVNNSVIM